MRPVRRDHLSALVESGFCVIPDLLSLEDVAALRARAEGYLVREDATADYRREALARRMSAMLLDSDRIPWLRPLMNHPGALAALSRSGIDDIRLWKAVLISKPPGSQRMAWHQDCLMWRDPRAYSERTPMLFLMWYLQDTDRGNGCLRVIPGSHRHRHRLHDAGVAHQYGFNEIAGDDPRLVIQPDEIDVPMRAGDLLVGDGRLFHATHANVSNDWRTVVTVWWHPWWGSLDARTRSMLGGWCRDLHAAWSEEEQRGLAAVWPHDDDGRADPAGWSERSPQAEWTLKQAW
jgi:ectoine hydroxylase-related dioxygenase (phytanoyl-CoA dioxygenase family)